MAGGIRNLKWILSGEDKSASKAIKGVGKTADETHRKFGVLAAGLAGGVLGGGVVDFFKGGLDGIKAQQDVAAQTAQVIKTMGNAAGVSQGHIEGLADKIEKMSGLQAENIQAGQNMLLTFDQIKGANFDRATNAMADMAARMGGDAVGAATMLGKALNDPAKGISALTRVGVSFSKQQQDQIKHMQATGDTAGAQTIILKSLEAQFGGSAKAAGKTMNGQMAILQARFGDVQESVVQKLLPALIKLADGLSRLLTFVQKNSAWLGPLVLIIGAVVGAYKGWIAIQTILNAELTANPIGLIIAAIAGLVIGLIYAYKHSETFRKVVTKMLDGVKAAASVFKTVVVGYFRFVANVWLTIVGTLVHAAAKAFGWVPGIGPKLKSAAREFDSFKDKVNKSLSGINETKTITIKAVSSTTAQAAANAGIRSGALSGSEAAASVTTRTHTTHVTVPVHLDGKKITTVTTKTTNRNTTRGHLAPGFL